MKSDTKTQSSSLFNKLNRSSSKLDDFNLTTQNTPISVTHYMYLLKRFYVVVMTAAAVTFTLIYFATCYINLIILM